MLKTLNIEQINNIDSRPAPPALVLFRRGGMLESVHRAYVCAADSSGKIVYSKGDPDYTTYMRSSAKPLQALAVLLSGAVDKFGISEQEIAIISGSHGGEPIHLETVKSILSKAGLDVSHLQCGVQKPLDAKARKELHRQGIKPQRVHHNCSGKHAGMLATARALNESLEDYLNPKSPAQKRITGLIAQVAKVKSEDIIIGIDGCGAPVHGVSMRAGAVSFANLIDPVDLEPELAIAARCVSRNMRAYPEMVAATEDRICTEIMRVGRMFELTAKAGAEGYYAVSWRDTETGAGIGMSVKVEDGAQRARDPLVIALLQKFGILPKDLGPSLRQFSPRPITNFKDEEVGSIEVRL